MSDYGNPDYWEHRYLEQSGKTFDWLENYAAMKPYIERFVPDRTNCKTLILGCGNAEFSEEMYDDGYHDIHNIDISANVID
jgi:hypothetical protein